MHNAKDITVENDDDFVLIRFTRISDSQINKQKFTYRIKERINPVYELLKSQKRTGDIKIPITYVQAERVAWRILKRWVDTQLAFIETGMIKFEEVFLSYIVDENTGMNPIEKHNKEQLFRNKWGHNLSAMSILEHFTPPVRSVGATLPV